MKTEEQIRREAANANLKVLALDWLKANSANVPTTHRDSCAYLDDTGWPAPCTCGFSNSTEVKVLSFIKTAILKADV